MPHLARNLGTDKAVDEVDGEDERGDDRKDALPEGNESGDDHEDDQHLVERLAGPPVELLEGRIFDLAHHQVGEEQQQHRQPEQRAHVRRAHRGHTLIELLLRGGAHGLHERGEYREGYP